MTRIFRNSGESIPVTVVAVEPNHVIQVKSAATDGYCALQVSVGGRRSPASKPLAGHFERSGVAPGRKIVEFRTEDMDTSGMNPGDRLDVDCFDPQLRENREQQQGDQDSVVLPGVKVDVTGVSRGKGYAGTVKRWNFKTQDASHGNSVSHRAPGSIGQCQTPGRVFKGKKMAGRMGGKRVTVQSLEVVRVDRLGEDRGELLLIKGAIPGAPGQDVIVRPAVKSRLC